MDACISTRRNTSEPQMRTLMVEGNSLLRRTTSFEVSGEKNELDEILYFRPANPAARAGDPTDYITQGEAVGRNELAIRIARVRAEEDGRSPPNKSTGAAKASATRVRSAWIDAGLVESVSTEKPWPIRLVQSQTQEEREGD